MSFSKVPLKRLGTVSLGKMLQNEPNAPTDVAAPYLRAANVQPRGLLIDVDDKTMWFGKVELEQHDLRANDVVVVEGGAGYGRSAVLADDRPGWGFQNSIVRVRPRPEVASGRFLNYALQWALKVGEIEVACFTATIPHFTAEKVGAFSVPGPSRAKQDAIADYLDRETARIDVLIEEQDRLIEMLHERRQALIDDAFAERGPHRVQLRRTTEFLTSGSRGWGDYYADDGQRFLRIGNMPRTTLDLRGEIQYVDLPPGVTEGSRTMLHKGDLLFSITAYLGSVALVDTAWVGAYVSQHVALCRLNQRQSDPRFVGWFILTTEGQHQLKEGAVGGTKMQLALDDIKNLKVPLAAMEEQHRVAVYLDEQMMKIDALIVETQRLIELARERRSALITAAVTGQIDVQAAA